MTVAHAGEGGRPNIFVRLSTHFKSRASRGRQRSPTATRVTGAGLVDTDDTKTMGNDIGSIQKGCSVAS